MATHVYGPNKELIQVSLFDKTLMLTLKDLFPDDPTMAKKLLKTKPNTPKGKLQHMYNVKDNSSLVRKIFRLYMKSVIWSVISGECMYTFPGNTKAMIYIDKMKDSLVRDKRSRGYLKDFDMLATNFTVPSLKYKFSPRSRRQELEIYVNKPYYKKLVDTANEGKRFSKYPRKMDYFLPSIYEQFPYIKEESIDRIIRYCSSRLAWNLRRGEEVRIVDKEGEIRFFRPLGRSHDRIMRTVKKRRITREKNKNERIS